jgi:protein ImuB
LSAQALGWWALQFTPRVAQLEEAVVLEVQASERLFGGAERLWERLHRGASEHRCRAMAQAPTAMAALALARHRARSADATPDAHSHAGPGAAHAHAADGTADPLARLASLPLDTLSAVGAHAETLHRLGCHNLGDVLKLPRGGLSRRFGAGLLHALDAAWGQRPEAFEWLVLPHCFRVQRELPWRIEGADALQQAFEPLLHELAAWLAGHHAATDALTLRWCHEWARHGDDRWREHIVRLAQACADVDRLSRMVREHLTRLALSAPVTDIGLNVDSLVRQAPDTLGLFSAPTDDVDGPGMERLTPSGQRAQRSALLGLLDRFSVRLGPDRVLVGHLLSDHRLAHRQHWLPAVNHLPEKAATGVACAGHHDASLRLPQPTWLLPSPLPLALASTTLGLRETPLYQGPLRLLAGPHRIEAGWWDTRADAPLEARDHHLASSPEAGLLWVYRERHAPQNGRSPWFLHGFFA